MNGARFFILSVIVILSRASAISAGGGQSTEQRARIQEQDNQDLCSVARTGDVPEVKRLIAARADVNYVRKFSNPRFPIPIPSDTPLMVARNAQVARVLLEAGAYFNYQDERGFTPLIRAAIHHEASIVSLLIDARADANAKDKNGGTPLIRAVGSMHNLLPQNNSIPVVRLLLAADVDVNHEDEDGYTALMQTIRYVPFMEEAFDSSAISSSIVSLLVDAKVDVNHRNKYGITPLSLAAH